MTSSTTPKTSDLDSDEAVVHLAALFARRASEKRWTWGDLARIAIEELSEKPVVADEDAPLRLFVDAIRLAPEGWTTVRTPEMAWEVLTTRDVEEISFGGAEVSATTVRWLHENGTAWPSVVRIHSAREDVRRSLVEKIEAYDTVRVAS